MSIYNLKPYIGGQPLVGGYNLPPYVGIMPLPIQLGAVAWYNFTDGSKIVEGATSTDVAGWKDSISELNPSQLLTNPEFDTDISGWGNNDNTVVVNNGIAEITSTVSGGFSSSFKQDYSTNQSGWYNLNFKVTKVDNPLFKVFILPFGASSPRPISISLAIGTYDEPFYYDSTVGTGTGFTVYFELTLPNVGEQLFLDYVRMKEYELAPYNLSQSSSSAQPVFTQPNGPVVFDGSDRLVEDTGALTFTNNATFAFRIKSGTQSANSRILSCKSIFSASAGFHIAFPLPTATDTMHIRGSGSTTYDQTLTTDTTTESNIIITFSGTTCKVWQDGVLQGTGTIDALSAGDVDLVVGSNGAGSEFFTGDFHELSCYQRALTDSEVLQLNSWMDR